MTRIPENDRNTIEQVMYLPMVITILERDRLIIEKAPFKLNKSYLNLAEEALRAVQKDLKEVKQLMRKANMKLEQLGHDDTFTQYMFYYKGYNEQHNYFNPRIRNKVNELLEFYLYKRYI